LLSCWRFSESKQALFAGMTLFESGESDQTGWHIMTTNKVLLTTLYGTITCVLLALLFFGTHLDDFNRPPVYLVVLGFAGSLSLALFQEKRTRDVIYINVLIYFFFAIVASMLRPITAVILLVYYTAMLLAVYTYVVHFDKKIADAFFIRPLLLAATAANDRCHSLLHIRIRAENRQADWRVKTSLKTC
jgi:hypothetical protein